MGESGDHHDGHISPGYHTAGVEVSVGEREGVYGDAPFGVGAIPSIGWNVGDFYVLGGLDGPALADGAVEEGGHLPAGDLGSGAVFGGVGGVAAEGDSPSGYPFDVGFMDAAVVIAEPTLADRFGGRRGGRWGRGRRSGRGRWAWGAASSPSPSPASAATAPTAASASSASGGLVSSAGAGGRSGWVVVVGDGEGEGGGIGG